MLSEYSFLIKKNHIEIPLFNKYDYTIFYEKNIINHNKRIIYQ